MSPRAEPPVVTESAVALVFRGVRMARVCVMTLLVCAAMVAGSVGSPAQVVVAPASAQSIVDGALARARAESKAVLIEFGASWCTWCRNFEAFVKSPDA